jgi:tRNA (guanine26-N2/guanine27-N2)-dimethyltransferase
MAPLCGVYPRACIRKYGGKPLRTEYCHELAVRLLAGCLATVAAKHEIGLRVLFSHSAEHYVRVYAAMDYGAKIADQSLSNMGYMLHCFKCFHRESLTGLSALGRAGKCCECDSKLSVGGPLWLGEIFDKSFCQLMEEEGEYRKLRNREKIKKILGLAKNEAKAPVGYYVVDRLCDALNLPVPSVKSMVEALRKEGFQACLTHFNPKGIRSDAPAMKTKELLIKTVKVYQ